MTADTDIWKILPKKNTRRYTKTFAIKPTTTFFYALNNFLIR